MTTGEAPWAQTACILCECNCGVEVQLDGRRLHRIRGDKAHPGSQGYTCNKAMRLDHYQNGPHRLTSPTRRRADGSYEEIDWDTAIDEIAQRFTRIRDEHGGESISSTAVAARATISGAATAARFYGRSARGIARARWRRRRPARRGLSTPSTGLTLAASLSMPRWRCSSARTRGCRRASRARGSSCTRSPRTQSGR